MLNRNAEALFWVGRYTERAENHARLMDVYFHVQQDPKESDAPHKWSRLVDALGCRQAYLQQYEGFNEKDVLSFIALDKGYSNSLISCVNHARSNIRTLREKLPGELWDVLNGFYLWLKEKQVQDIVSDSPHLFFKRVKEWTACFQGVQQSVMLRENEWHFIETGRYLERGENTVRILNSVHQAAQVSEEPAYSYLLAVLKSVSGEQAFRRFYADAVSAQGIVDFLIWNEVFPRSVHGSLSMLIEHLKGIHVDLQQERVIRLAGKIRTDIDFLDREGLLSEPAGLTIHNLTSSFHNLGFAIDKTFFRAGEASA